MPRRHGMHGEFIPCPSDLRGKNISKKCHGGMGCTENLFRVSVTINYYKLFIPSWLLWRTIRATLLRRTVGIILLRSSLLLRWLLSLLSCLLLLFLFSFLICFFQRLQTY